jgi:hypothetical protein
MHFGGGHFGGMHVGGGHFGGAHFGGAHLGGGHFGGARFGHFGGSHFGMRHFAFGHGHGNGFGMHRSFAGARGFGHAGGEFAGGHRFGASPAGHEFAGAGRDTGREPSGRTGADAIGRNREGGRFEHGQFGARDFRRGFVGWAGPVFWPYAYDDLFDYAFWPYGDYGPGYDPFWAYGYDDLFAGVLVPYGAGSAYVGASGGAPPVAGSPQANASVPASAVAGLCVSADPAGGGIPIDQIVKTVHPNSEQQAKLDALKAAEAAAQKVLRKSCATQMPATALERLDAVQARLQDMIEAVDILQTPLNDFYSSLTDEQKARFNTLGQNWEQAGKPASLAEVCGPQNAVPPVPVDKIEKAVQPDSQQRSDLDALRDAANEADQTILASCPAQPPMTPPGRLQAVRDRLQAMLRGVETVRPALQRFYASLRADQKSRFDAVNQQVASAPQSPRM